MPRIGIAESLRRGQIMSAALYGSWRSTPPLFDGSLEELNQIIPSLVRTGSAGLCWHRLRQGPLRIAVDLATLQGVYKLQTLRVAAQFPQIKRIFSLMRRFNVEPIMGKGWAVSRLYPERGMRSTGDIDLYVKPEEYAVASKILWEPEASGCQVDLHEGCPQLDDRSFEEVRLHSCNVKLEEAAVRILGCEDHLRLLCIHMMAHGVWRPLWLADVALAFESRPQDFDWEYFLMGNKHRTETVILALCLARELLGADLRGAPEAIQARSVPGWMTQAVLREWGNPKIPHGMRAPLMSLLGQPRELFHGLFLRWPNPIEATVNVRAPFNGLPRIIFQVEEGMARTCRFLLRFSNRAPRK